MARRAVKRPAGQDAPRWVPKESEQEPSEGQNRLVVY